MNPQDLLVRLRQIAKEVSAIGDDDWGDVILEAAEDLERHAQQWDPTITLWRRDAMTYEGLLTYDEARACEGAGYSAGWLCHGLTIGGYGLVRWTSSANAAGDALFAPMPGHWLPVAAAPKDERQLLVRLRDSVEVMRSREEPHFFEPEWRSVLGWQPVITAKERP